MPEGDAELRARLKEELGFYPASLDPASIAEHRRKTAEADGRPVPPAPPVVVETRTEEEEIEARKKKAERGWLVEPERPRIGFSPVEEIERWYTVIGIRGRAAS